MGPLSTLRPLGLTEEVLILGEHIVVRANPNRLGAGRTVVGLDVTTSNGTIYPLHIFGRSRPPPAALKADNLAGQWVPTTDGLGGHGAGRAELAANRRRNLAPPASLAIRVHPLAGAALDGVADAANNRS